MLPLVTFSETQVVDLQHARYSHSLLELFFNFTTLTKVSKIFLHANCVDFQDSEFRAR